MGRGQGKCRGQGRKLTEDEVHMEASNSDDSGINGSVMQKHLLEIPNSSCGLINKNYNELAVF